MTWQHPQGKPEGKPLEFIVHLVFINSRKFPLKEQPSEKTSKAPSRYRGVFQIVAALQQGPCLTAVVWDATMKARRSTRPVVVLQYVITKISGRMFICGTIGSFRETSGFGGGTHFSDISQGPPAKWCHDFQQSPASAPQDTPPTIHWRTRFAPVPQCWWSHLAHHRGPLSPLGRLGPLGPLKRRGSQALHMTLFFGPQEISHLLRVNPSARQHPGLQGLHAKGHLPVACDPLESAGAGRGCHLGFWDELVNEFLGASKV